MNRWWGDKDDSNRQSGERAQRAARRTISSLPLNLITSDSDNEENFEDAELSFSTSLNIDGAPGDDQPSRPPSAQSSSSSSSSSAMDAATLAAEKAKPVKDANFPDDEDAWKKELKLKFDRHDVKYWLNKTENDLKKFGINTQWSKRSAIESVLPDDVIEELKPLLRLTEDEAASNIYALIRQEILTLFGPREEDAFKKAMSLRLTGKPSALGKQLIHAICPGAKPFESCHCAKMVYGFWEAQMTLPIKTMLAGKSFNVNTYQDIFTLADEVFYKNGGTTSSAVVASAAVSSPTSSEPVQVAAFQRGGGQGGRGRGRGGRGGRGGQRGAATNTSQPRNNNSQNQNNSSQQPPKNQNSSSYQPKAHQKGPRAHPDVPDNACSRHWKEGRSATYCSDPLVCSWVHVIAPRKS